VFDLFNTRFSDLPAAATDAVQELLGWRMDAKPVLADGASINDGNS
jgi:hypothetical protein